MPSTKSLPPLPYKLLLGAGVIFITLCLNMGFLENKAQCTNLEANALLGVQSREI